MVESTPENLAPYLLYWWIVHLCKFWNIFSFTFSNIIPEPSTSQQCTTWQKNNLNLTNMAHFHYFCIKQSKTAQILYERGAIIYESPCIYTAMYFFMTNTVGLRLKTLYMNKMNCWWNTGWFVINGPPFIQDLSCFWLS